MQNSTPATKNLPHRDRKWGLSIKLSIVLGPVLLVISSLPARAQTTTPAPPRAAPALDAASVPAPPDPATGTPGATVTAPAQPEVAATAVTDLAARLDELEQVARIASRKHELLEEEAAKRAKEVPTTSFDDKGFAIKSGDGAYVLKIRGLLQADGRFFLDDDILQDRDTFLVRRFRPSIEGTLFKVIDYRLLPDFAGSQAQVMDGYIDVHPTDWLRLRVGKMKAPIGLERLQSDADLPFVERAVTQNLSTVRDVGAQLWGDIAAGVVHYAIGVFNGGPDGTNLDVDTNHAKDFIGRLFFQPFKTENLNWLGNLGLGIAASTGDRKGLPQVGSTPAAPGLPTFRTFGQNTFFSYAAATPDPSGTLTTFAHLRASRLNPQLYYYTGPFGLLSEFILSRQEVQRGNSTATLTHQSAHATVTYSINGKEGYDGVTPLVPFDPAKGAWGALQLAVRWGWLKVDENTFADPNVSGSVGYADPLRSAREVQTFAGAVTYVPRRSFRLAIGFEQTRFKGGAGAVNRVVADRTTENVLIGRAQVSF